jgi:hypothetical protein
MTCKLGHIDAKIGCTDCVNQAMNIITPLLQTGHLPHFKMFRTKSKSEEKPEETEDQVKESSMITHEEDSDIRYPKLLHALKRRHHAIMLTGDQERLGNFEDYIKDVREADQDFEYTKSMVERDKNDDDPVWTQDDLKNSREEFHDAIHSDLFHYHRSDVTPRHPDFCDLCDEDEKNEGFKVI